MNLNLYELLNQEKKTAERLMHRAEKEMKRMPGGTLEARLTKGKYPQYVHTSSVNGKRVSKYISKKNLKLARQLAQRDYDRDLMRSAAQLTEALETASKALREYDLEAIYQKEKNIRRNLITPLIPTDEMFIEQWYEEHHGAQNSLRMTNSYTTIRGETVRSKSEKMIADAYHMAGIPYVYEPSVCLANGHGRRPDFAVLNVRLRKTMYHEHFGMMDDDEYRQHAILKMREYNRSGYRAGEVMLYTFEGEGIPFDQEELEELIRAFLM